MTISLSTRWNAYRHGRGETLIEEILGLGFRSVELGYDLTADLVPGVESRVAAGEISVCSVHNFCPVPLGVPQGHPELWLLASRYPAERAQAVRQVTRTLEFAAQVGARTVVCHAGRLKIRSNTLALISLFEDNRQYTPRYEKTKIKMLLKREKKVGKLLDGLYFALEELMPVLESTQVRLALENLPSWEAIPTEMEMEEIQRRFDSPWLGYWHDVGHGQIRQNLGLVSVTHWLQRLRHCLFGMHVHDVAPPGHDHLMPGLGTVNFAALKDFVGPALPLVLEPSPGTPELEVRDGLAVLREAWGPEADFVSPRAEDAAPENSPL